ncbi:MAG TPA: hypothetical protein VGD99_08715 [Anaerolineae bacterium]|jgi:rubrerythrin
MSIRRDLEKRAQKAILKYIFENQKNQRADWNKKTTLEKAVFGYSFFRTSNAILIGSIIVLTGCVTLLAFPALGLIGGLWLVVGGLGGLIVLAVTELMFLVRGFQDEKLHAKAVADLLKTDPAELEFSTDSLRDKDLKERVDKALEYWALIDDTVSQTPKGVLRDRLVRTTQEVTHWLQAVYNLAERVDKFRLNKVIERDLKSVPKAIHDYEQKLARESNPDVSGQLEKTIADKKRQLQTLQNLYSNMENADLQLDSTISSLGTIYSQLLLVDSKDEEGSRISRLQEEISEQVYQLEDLTEAMDDVYRRSA